MFGKIIDGKLQIAGQIIKNKNGGTISNPKVEELIANGYKEIVYTEKPIYDTENFKLVEILSEADDKIYVTYGSEQLTDEEKKQKLIDKVNQLEQEYNMCRWEREIILSENSGASEYTKTKAQEIENISVLLRG